MYRISCQLRRTFVIKPDLARRCSSGPIVIEKESTLELRSAIRPSLEIRASKSGERSSAIQNERKSGSVAAVAISNPILSSHVLRAAREPVELDEWQASAVAARIELDLRIGAAFTRLQTLQLQAVVAILKEKVISYGMRSR